MIFSAWYANKIIVSERLNKKQILQMMGLVSIQMIILIWKII